MRLRVILVDDEAMARRHLARLLRPHASDIEIVGEADNGFAAVDLIQKETPDALFLDVQLPGMDGFQVVRQLAKQPLIVFTTAYDQHALLAFRENAIDYLLKPIGADDVERAVRKLHMLTSASVGGEMLVEGLISRIEAGQASHILLPVGDAMKRVSLAHIVYLEACDKSTTIHTTNGKYDVDSSLAELQARLPARQFIRIHRGHLVNVEFIAELQRWGARQLKVVLTVPTDASLYVSRRCVDDVRRRLG